MGRTRGQGRQFGGTEVAGTEKHPARGIAHLHEEERRIVLGVPADATGNLLGRRRSPASEKLPQFRLLRSVEQLEVAAQFAVEQPSTSRENEGGGHRDEGGEAQSQALGKGPHASW